MARLLTRSPVSEETRSAHDRHRLWPVLATLSLLSVYIYLFTYAADQLGLPRPEMLAEQLGVHVHHVFDDDHNVDSTVLVSLTQRFDSNDDERLVLFLVIGCAFLCAYYLPLRFKHPSLVGWTSAGLWLLYGPAGTSGLLATHLVLYLVLHPQAGKRGTVISGVAGFLGNAALGHGFDPEEFSLFAAAGSVVGAVLLYRAAILPALGMRRCAAVLRTVAVQSAIITVAISALAEGLGGSEWKLPLGVLLFFWQWERLMMYHIDYKDGLVPDQVGLGAYLIVFLNPGVMPNWNWGVTIGQGYAYTHNNYLCEDKNTLVLSGLRLWCLALLYISFWNWARHGLIDIFQSFDVAVHRAYTKQLVEDFVRGRSVDTVSVLATTFLDLCRWIMLWAGVVHFKVGLWRICGFRVDPYINKPWLATNLSTFWPRITFHYREFLVRAFYYPVFFRFFRSYPQLRIFVSIMAAATFGNLVWGHMTERLFYRGMEWEHLLHVLGTWPYFVLLGVGIGTTQLYLNRRKRRRKPWTLDRWFITDVVAAYCTLQFYALIHIFARPVDGSSVWDLTRLFLIGFGIRLDS